MQGFPLAGYYQNTNQNTKSTIVSLENGFWDRLKAGVDIWYAVGEQVSGRRADRLPWLPVAWVHLHLGHHRMVEVVHEITCTQNLFELENFLDEIILFGEVQSGVWALTKFLGNVNIWSRRVHAVQCAARGNIQISVIKPEPEFRNLQTNPGEVMEDMEGRFIITPLYSIV